MKYTLAEPLLKRWVRPLLLALAITQGTPLADAATYQVGQTVTNFTFAARRSFTRPVNVHEAKTHLSRLLEDVRAGEEIVVAKNGTPYARLVPLDTPTKRRLGFVEGRITDDFFDPLPDDELDAWDGITSSLGG